MGLLNEQPHNLEEYVTLKFEMRTFEKKFARATSSTEKLELQAQWEKFCAMEPVYDKVGCDILCGCSPTCQVLPNVVFATMIVVRLKELNVIEDFGTASGPRTEVYIELSSLSSWFAPMHEYWCHVVMLSKAYVASKKSSLNFPRTHYSRRECIQRLSSRPVHLFCHYQVQLTQSEKRHTSCVLLPSKQQANTNMGKQQYFKLWGLLRLFAPQILAAKEQFELVRADRDQAQVNLMTHGKIMAQLKHEEIEAANRITADHVHACDQEKSLGEIFPGIQASKGRATERFGFLSSLAWA